MNVDKRTTFETVARDYHAVRPGYPTKLIGALQKHVPMRRGTRLLEVGCGTGQLTHSLASLGCNITAIDMGTALIDVARAHICRPNVTFQAITFEDFANTNERYDVIVAATCFHWLDPHTRLANCTRLLKPGGALAIIQNTSRTDLDDPAMRSRFDEIYTSVIPPIESDGFVPLATKTQSICHELETCARFEIGHEEVFPHEHILSASDYIRLLGTFSYQANLPDFVRRELFTQIFDVVKEVGYIKLMYDARLIIARHTLG